MEVDVRNEEDRNPPSPESCTKFIQSLSADGFKKPVLLPLLQKTYCTCLVLEYKVLWK